MLGFGNLLLDFLFIIVSVFAFASFWEYRKGWSDFAIGVICGIGTVFCMTFPFTVFPGYLYDLRIVPLLLATLYGGIPYGGFVAVVLIAYRFYLGGAGVEATLYSYIPIFLVTVACIRIFGRSSRNNAMLLGVALALFSSVTVSAISLFIMDSRTPELYLFFGIYCLLVTGCMWMSSFLIETLRENAQMRSELQRSEKMHVLGQLAATIAHEIRNPLTVTKGFLQLLRSRARDDLDRNYVRMALEEVDRAESIISDYLTYSKPHTEDMEPMNVKEQIQNIVNIMESFIVSNGHLLHVHLEDSLYVLAEPKKFSQVIINLIKNAVEAMKESGKLTIRSYRNKEHVVIQVEDTGSGMTEEQINRLGHPFYSTKDNGTGLGLMVSYRIVEAMKGRVNVRSEIGKGTAFAIVIPLLKEDGRGDRRRIRT